MDYKRSEATKKEIKLDNQQIEALLQQKIDQLEKTNTEYAKKSKDVSDADSICKICKRSAKADENLTGTVPDDLSTLRPLLTKPWPVKFFKRTILVEKDSVSVLPNHRVIMSDRLFVDKEGGRPSKLDKLEKDILSQFPNLDNETPTKCPGGYNITLEEVINCKIKGSGKNLEKRRTIAIMLRHNAEGDNLEKVHGQLLDLKQAMIEAGVDKTFLVVPTYIDSNVLRKTLECVFKDTQVNIQVIVEKGAIGSYANATRGKVRRERGEAIIIESSEGKGYDSLLATLKEKMDSNSAAAIKGVQKTSNGNLLLQVRENAIAADLKNQVVGILDTNKIRIADGLSKQTLFIRGIDSMAATEEIRGKILFFSKPEHPEDVKITVNQNARGQQSAVVTMLTKDAERLLSLQTIRIGFSDCHIQERISVERCYKCWDFGHNARACTKQDVDMSNCCYKCGQPGHHKAKCDSETEFCPTCKREGHQSGTGKCRFFKAALNREKRTRKESAASATQLTANYDQT